MDKKKHEETFTRGLAVAATTIKAHINMGIREKLSPSYILWLVYAQCEEYTAGLEDEMEEFLLKLPRPQFKKMDQFMEGFSFYDEDDEHPY